MSKHTVHRLETWDHLAEWVAGYREVVCLTAAQRVAFLVGLPEPTRWTWFDLGRRHVGIGPYRLGDHFTGDAVKDGRVFLSRLNALKARGQSALP